VNLLTPISQFQFSSLVQSAYPQTLDLGRFCAADPYLDSLLALTLPDLDFTQFFQRYMAGSFPTVCEQLLNTSYFIPDLTLLNKTSTFSADTFEPVVSGPILN
jgi:hypothetical protein